MILVVQQEESRVKRRKVRRKGEQFCMIGIRCRRLTIRRIVRRPEGAMMKLKAPRDSGGRIRKCVAWIEATWGLTNCGRI